MTPTKKVKEKVDQHARFVEAARQAGADVDSDAADRLMGKLAKMPPDPKPAPKTKGVSQPK